MTDSSELKTGIAAVRGLLDRVEQCLDNGQDDPVLIRATLVKLAGALMAHGRPARKSKKPLRGVGYSFDEALIVASLPDHSGNLTSAVRAHYPDSGPEWIEAVVRRIRGDALSTPSAD